MRPAYEVLAALRDAFDRHDVDAIARLYAPEASTRRPDGSVAATAEVAAAYAEWFAVEPDVRVDLRAAVGDERVAMAEFAAVGGNGIRPFVIVIEVVEDLIVGERYYAAVPADVPAREPA